MRSSGTIIKWDDEKGFGFIAPNDRSDDVFLHCRALTERVRRPKLGDWVEYDLAYDIQHRPRAARAVLRQSLTVPQTASQTPSRRITASSRPQTFGRKLGPGEVFFTLLLPAIVLSGASLAARRGFIPEWVAVLYVGMSAVTAVGYAVDKYRAQKGRWRIAEGTLQLFAMAGGWPGAFPAQRILRHKTSKLSFQVTYWIIVVAHLAFWSWFAATQCGWLRR
jgi:uncharacterized membrane protein YsdA (DUF1294 family)/cold shock CspA family protein